MMMKRIGAALAALLLLALLSPMGATNRTFGTSGTDASLHASIIARTTEDSLVQVGGSTDALTVDYIYPKTVTIVWLADSSLTFTGAGRIWLAGGSKIPSLAAANDRIFPYWPKVGVSPGWETPRIAIGHIRSAGSLVKGITLQYRVRNYAEMGNYYDWVLNFAGRSLMNDTLTVTAVQN